MILFDKLKENIPRIIFFTLLLSLLCITSLGVAILVMIDNSNSNPGSTAPAFIDSVNEIAPLKTPVNILLLAESGGNTDTIMVTHFDPVTCEISIISVLRDTAVNYNGSITKVNSIYARAGGQNAGSVALSQVVSKLLGVNIDYYVYVDTDMTKKIVEELGGVYYNVPCRMKYTAKSQNLYIDLQPGYQRLNGSQVEQLLRFRHPDKSIAPPYNALTVADYADCPEYLTNDVQRAKTQQSFLKEFIKQKAKPEILVKLSSLMKIVFENVRTDIKFMTILRLLYNSDKISAEKVKTYSINFSSPSYRYLGTLKYNNSDKTLEKILTLEETNELLLKDFASAGTLSQSNLSEAASYRASIGMGSSGSGNTPNSSPTEKPLATPKKTARPATTPKPTPISTSNPTVQPSTQPTSQPTAHPTENPTDHPVETKPPATIQP